MSFLDNFFTVSSQMVAYLGELAGTVADGRVAVDLHGTTLSGDISAVVDAVEASGSLTNVADVVTVAMQGRPYAGFAVGTGFTGTITFEASRDGGVTYKSVQTYSSSTVPATIAGATLALTATADDRGILVPLGATHVRARVSAATSGTCTATIRATVTGVVQYPQLDTIVTALGSYLSTIAGAVSGSRMAVDLATAVTNNIATLAGAISGGLMQAFAPDVTASNTITAVNDAVAVAMSGRRHASFSIGAGFNGSVYAEASLDGGTTYAIVAPYSIATVPPTIATTTVLSGSAVYRGIIVPPGATHVRVRVQIATSGSATATVRATMAGTIHVSQQLPAALGPQAKASVLCTTLATDDPSLTKLDTLHTDLAPGGPKMDQVGSIGTSADVQFSSKTLLKGMAIKNISTSGQSLYLRDVATPTSSNSCVLLPGEWTNDIECTNANQVYMRASASGGAACYSGR